MQHGFNIYLATEIGLNDAIILQQLYVWYVNNAHNNINFVDNRYWVYNSVLAFQKQFPYLSAKQIITVLNKLEVSNIIISEALNQANYDRTKWYSITEIGLNLLENYGIHREVFNAPENSQNLQKHPSNALKSELPKRANRITQKGKSSSSSLLLNIEYNTNSSSSLTNIRNNINNTIEFKKEEEEKEKIYKKEKEKFTFDEFWQKYDYKISRPKCEKLYAKIKIADREKIFQHLDKYIPSTPEKKFRKHPSTYLNNKAWEDEIITRDNFSNMPNKKLSVSAFDFMFSEVERKLPENDPINKPNYFLADKDEDDEYIDLN